MNLSRKEKALLRKFAEEAAEATQAALKLAETGDKAWLDNLMHELADVDALRDHIIGKFMGSSTKGVYMKQYDARFKKATDRYGE